MSIGNFDTSRIEKHTTIAMWLSWGVIVALLIWCFVIPPRGENAEFILKACTLVYAIIPMAVAREAYKEGKGARFTHGDTHIEIDKDKE